MDLIQQLHGHVEALSVVRHPVTNPVGLEVAREYIAGHLTGLGFSVRLQQVTSEPVPQFNVLARVSGDVGPRRVVVEAHYDTVPGSPGADDNASGVAAVLEVARLVGPTPGIEFACFCLEEDRLRGSAAYVDELAWSEQPELIDLEMVGYTLPGLFSQVLPLAIAGTRLRVPLPGLGGAIAIVGDWRSRRLARALAVSCVRRRQAAVPLSLPGLAWLIPDIRRSDHALFWRRGLPAVMVTDTANFRNPNYHRPTDTPDTLDLAFTARITAAVAAYVRDRVKRV